MQRTNHMLYRIKQGFHRAGRGVHRTTYKQGDVIDSETDLAAKFPNKFEAVVSVVQAAPIVQTLPSAPIRETPTTTNTASPTTPSSITPVFPEAAALGVEVHLAENGLYDIFRDGAVIAEKMKRKEVMIFLADLESKKGK